MNFSSDLDLDSGLLEKLLGLAELLPPSYAEYRPLLADALLFFLMRLYPARQQAIYDAQRALPARARQKSRAGQRWGRRKSGCMGAVYGQIQRRRAAGWPTACPGAFLKCDA